jgi:hypothetical protein
MCGYRGDVSSGVSDRVLSQLLTELDGVHVSYAVIVLAVLLPRRRLRANNRSSYYSTVSKKFSASNCDNGLLMVCCYRA